MNVRRLWALLPPWSALVAWLVYVSVVWSRLPERMAVHFSASGDPNGWATKSAFVIPFSLFWIVIMVALSWVLSKSACPAWLILASLYFTAVVFAASGVETVLWNLGQHFKSVGIYVCLVGVPLLVSMGILHAVMHRSGRTSLNRSRAGL